MLDFITLMSYFKLRIKLLKSVFGIMCHTNNGDKTFVLTKSNPSLKDS